jgi:transposase
MSPEYVRPYVKAQKNDDRDAEAIAEAATRPTMRFVEPKSEAQLDLQALHRVRDRLVAERTALINQIRALLLERGISVPQGRWRLARELPTLLSDETAILSPRIGALLADMAAEWAAIDRRITALDKEFAAIARNDDRARRLASIPGDRSAHRFGSGGCGGRGAELRTRTRFGGLARSRAAAGDHGRSAEAARDQPTRQQVFAQAPGPRGTLGTARPRHDRYTAWALAHRSSGAGAQEHGGGGVG